MIARSFLCAAALAATLPLAGCGRSPSTNFYMFSPLAPVAAPLSSSDRASSAVAGVEAGPQVAVIVGIPAYLDRPQMVVRGDNGVSVRLGDYHQWSEPVGDGVTRVLCDRLCAALAPVRGLAFPLRSALPADWRISVDIARLDGSPGGEATIEALWTLGPAQGAAETAAGRFVSRIPVGNDMAALAEAESILIVRLAETLAAELADVTRR